MTVEEAVSRRTRTSILRCPLISLMRGLMGPSFSFDSVNNTARPPPPSPAIRLLGLRLVIMSSRINVITRTRVRRGRKGDVPVRGADDSCRRNEKGRTERAMSRMLLTQVATDLSSSTRAILATVNRENQLSHLQVRFASHLRLLLSPRFDRI